MMLNNNDLYVSHKRDVSAPYCELYDRYNYLLNISGNLSIKKAYNLNYGLPTDEVDKQLDEVNRELDSIIEFNSSWIYSYK